MEDDSDVWPPDDVAEPSEKSSGIFRMAGKVQGPAVVAARLALENATMSQLPPLWGHFPINPLPGYNRRIEPVRARDDGTDVPHAAEHQAVHTQDSPLPGRRRGALRADVSKLWKRRIGMSNSRRGIVVGSGPRRPRQGHSF